MPVSAAYDLVETFNADVAALNTAIFVVPLVVALLIEGPLLVYCERFRREYVLGFGLVGMGLSLLGCAFAPNLYTFAAAFSLFYPSSGVACGIAQAALMDADPERREQRMTEWAISGWIGDLGGPLLLWAADIAGVGYRGAFGAMSVALFAAAWVFSRRALSGEGTFDDDEDDATLPIRETLRLLAGQRLLFLWLLAVAFCSLLDEIVAALIGLRLAPDGGARAVATSLTAFTLGGVFGLLPMKALLARMPGTRVLVLTCIGCAVAYTAWLLAPGSYSPFLLFIVGAFTAAHYPIAQAQAYQALSERSTLVAAAGQPFTVFDGVLPLLIGWLADEAGVLWALAVLLAQPMGIALVCWRAQHTSRARRAL